MKVRLYWNLHRDCYSIKDCSTNRVCGYRDTAVLEKASLVVYESGRLRVLKTREKNVHAFVQGFLSEEKADIPEHAFRVCYNPYRGPDWTRTDGTIVEEISKAWCVTVEGKPQIFAI